VRRQLALQPVVLVLLRVQVRRVEQVMLMPALLLLLRMQTLQRRLMVVVWR
jgi:hypothetical protein